MTQSFFGYNDSDDDYGSCKTVQRPYLPASSMCGRYLENNPKVYWQRPQTRGHGPRMTWRHGPPVDFGVRRTLHHLDHKLMVYRGRSPIILWDYLSNILNIGLGFLGSESSSQDEAFPGCWFTYPKSQAVLCWSPPTCGHTENNMLAVLTIMPLESWSVRCPAVVLVGFQGREQTASSVGTWQGVSGFGIVKEVWCTEKRVFTLCLLQIFFQSTVLVEDWIQLNLPAPIREMSSGEKGPSFRSRKFCGSLDLLQNLTGHGKALPANGRCPTIKKGSLWQWWCTRCHPLSQSPLPRAVRPGLFCVMEGSRGACRKKRWDGLSLLTIGWPWFLGRMELETFWTCFLSVQKAWSFKCHFVIFSGLCGTHTYTL